MRGFPGGPGIRNPSPNAGDTGLTPGPRRPTCLGATKPKHHNKEQPSLATGGESPHVATETTVLCTAKNINKLKKEPDKSQKTQEGVLTGRRWHHLSTKKDSN